MTIDDNILYHKSNYDTIPVTIFFKEEIKMGLFSNYEKPGRGIDKYGPQKKGIFLYFELFFRKFTQLFKTNMLYFLISLPVFFVYHFIIYYDIKTLVPESFAGGDTDYLVFIATFIIAILWGTGFVSCGFSYNLRNFAKDEHVWIGSDFFGQIRKNLKQGLIFFAVDILALFLLPFAGYVYAQMAAAGNKLALVLVFLVLLLALIYTFAHFYIYQLAVTFKNKLREIYKNAFILALATAPICLALTVLVGICTFYVGMYLTPAGITVLCFFIWLVLLRFPIEFYALRVIKDRLMPTNEESDY